MDLSRVPFVQRKALRRSENRGGAAGEVCGRSRGGVARTGMGLLRELADLTGLSAQVTAVLADTYRGRGPIRRGGVRRSGRGGGRQGGLHRRSRPAVRRPRARVRGRPRHDDVAAGRSADRRRAPARRRAAQGGGSGRRPGRPGRPHRQTAPLYIDIDATLVIDHSDNKAGCGPDLEEVLRPPSAAGVLDRPSRRR